MAYGVLNLCIWHMLFQPVHMAYGLLSLCIQRSQPQSCGPALCLADNAENVSVNESSCFLGSLLPLVCSYS